MALRDVAVESRDIPIGLIDEPVLPSRSQMSDEKLDELAESIKTDGLINPIVVVPRGERYETVAGHRRRIAAGRAGLAFVPCRVYPDRGAALEAIKHAENRFREELSPAEEAIWFAELLERDHGGDVDRLAAWLNEKRGYVENRLLLLSGDEQVFKALEQRKIPIGVAQQLNLCTDPLHRRMLLDMAVRGGATVALVTGWIQEWKTIHAPANARANDQAQPSIAPLPSVDPFFKCPCCGESDHTEAMRPVMVHDYCRVGTLDKALAFWERRRDLTAWPRTVDELEAMLAELDKRFPSYFASTSAS